MTQYALIIASSLALVAGIVAMLFQPGGQWPGVLLNLCALCGFALIYWIDSKKTKSELEIKVDQLEQAILTQRDELSALKMAAGFVHGGGQ